METATPTAYESDLEYLDNVLSLISLRLQREVLIQRRLRGDTRQESFLGLFLSDEDIDAIFKELHGYQLPQNENSASLDQQIKALQQHIISRVKITELPLPPQRLATLFGLNNNEIDLLLYLLAAEVDNRFGRVYGFLHDDVSRKRLSPGLAFRLMQDSVSSMMAFRRLFSEMSPLVFYRLIGVGNGQDKQKPPLMERPLRLENRIVDYLLGDDHIDSALFGYVTLREPTAGALEAFPKAYYAQATKLAQHLKEQTGFLVLEGGLNSDTDYWASIIATRLGGLLLELDWRIVGHLDKVQRRDLLVKAQREARLQSALLYLRRMDEASTEDFVGLNRLLIGPVCIATDKPHQWHDIGLDAITVVLPKIPTDTCSQLWHHALLGADGQGLTFTSSRRKLARKLAERYPISNREMQDVMHGLGVKTLFSEAGKNTEEHIVEACKRLSGRAMDGAAQRIDTLFRFNDLVLPAVTLNLLNGIIMQQQHGERVLQDWALGRLFHQAQGCRALFAGPSGTGKTMAASVLANELGLELYRVDLSQVVSKYIGETEKNLNKVFNTASYAQIVLFIDEADALFGKRSEVKDAHDRYANIETSFLLQKMEEYDGIAILATNFSQNMDDAFFRRIDTIVEFPMPQVSDRLRLWQRLFDSTAPLSQDVALEFLAKNFELSGGHIKNCILNAAYYAAEKDQAIAMVHLMYAVGREYMKIGKPISKTTFGEFYNTIRKNLTVY